MQYKEVTISELVTALESGKYERLSSRLGDDHNRRCCLGVLCELAGVPFLTTEYDENGEVIGEGDNHLAITDPFDGVGKDALLYDLEYDKKVSPPRMSFAPWLACDLARELMELNDNMEWDDKSYYDVVVRLRQAEDDGY